MINTLQKLIYSHCQIMFILCFMPKRSILAHRYPSGWPLKTFMQGGHKPFSYVTISFSLKHYLVCSRFCQVWTLLLCIWKTDGFAWLYVCVSLNLVTCVIYLFAERNSRSCRHETPLPSQVDLESINMSMF